MLLKNFIAKKAIKFFFYSKKILRNKIRDLEKKVIIQKSSRTSLFE